MHIEMYVWAKYPITFKHGLISYSSEAVYGMSGAHGNRCYSNSMEFCGIVFHFTLKAISHSGGYDCSIVSTIPLNSTRNS